MKTQSVIGYIALLLAGSAAAFGQQASKSTPHYVIRDLGTLGGTASQAYYVNQWGVVSGQAALSNGTEHATLWYRDKNLDIGTPGFGGAGGSATLNSTAFSVTDFNQAVGSAEIPTADPNGENFCSYGSGHTCVPFVWQFGFMTRLSGLGGPNGFAFAMNKAGEIIGVAETNSADSSCASVTPGQILDYQAVKWNLWRGTKSVLAPLPNDTIGVGLWINDKGQSVGQSGRCDNTILPPLVSGPHAVLWEKDGTVRDLGNLGGECLSLCVNPVFGPIGNIPFYISDEGKVVGASVTTGEQTMHAFVWPNQAGKMQDLGTLPGDIGSLAFGINQEHDIVGTSYQQDNGMPLPRAFLRKKGQMLDLNALVPTDATIYALVAQFINGSGEITGIGVEKATGDTHAFLAIPCDSDQDAYTWKSADQAANEKVILSDQTRKQLRQLMRGIAFNH